MRGKLKLILAVVLCTITFCMVISIKDDVDKINDRLQVKVEEPQRITGKWQIVLYQPGIFPPKIVKTDSYYIRDKVLWYQDEDTGEDIPVIGDCIALPDDGRDLEAYGVYDVEPIY